MKRDEQRVFPGSLNLLPPSDKSGNDAIALQNFRVDQSGVLRGGDTFSVLCNVGAAIHTIVRLQDYPVTQPGLLTTQNVQWGSGGAFLIGAGTELFFYAPNLIYGTPGLSTLATGFSGNPLSIVLWNGFIWVLDSVKQIKINPAILCGEVSGTAVSSWLPAVPATTITAAPALVTGSGTGALTPGSATYYLTYSLTPTSTAQSAGGPGVTITTPSAGVNTLTSIPVPPSYVYLASLYRQSGSLAHPYLVANFAWDQILGFGNGGLVSAAAPFLDSFSDAELLAVGIVMPTVAGTGAPAAPTAAPSVSPGLVLPDSLTTGAAYQYYCTFVNSAGLETNPGPVSISVTVTENGVALTTIPISPDPDTVKRRIYRTGGTLGSVYQVVELEDNTTTSYIDSQSDLALTELGIIMPTTNDPPPSGVATDSVGVVGPYFNELLAWKNGKMYWSQEGIPLFPGSEDGVAEGNWVNVGDPDEKIQAITLHARLAAIYKQRTVWRLEGDAETGTLEQTAATCGAVSKTAVAVAGSIDLMLSSDGVYSFSMDSLTAQSNRIAPVFMGQQWIQFGASDITQPTFSSSGFTTRGLLAFFNGTALIGNCSDAINAQFLLSAGTYGNDTPASSFSAESVRCAEFASQLGYAITAALNWGSQYTWYAGDSAGNLLVSSQQARSGQQIVWQTPFLDQGMGDTPKSYQEVVIDAELNGATATVYVFYDNSGNAGAKAGATQFTLAGTHRKKFYLSLAPTQVDADGSLGQDLYPHISVRIEINCTATGVSPAIHGLYIYYTMEERDAAVRGSQMLDFHSERITVCKKMEVDAVGQVDIAIWTDLPGGITQRMVYSGAASSTRGIFEFPLQPNTRGRLWRIDVLPQNATARVYAVRGWMREIGLPGQGEWAWRDFIAGTEAEMPDEE